jgi:hypothetical protein
MPEQEDLGDPPASSRLSIGRRWTAVTIRLMTKKT